MDATVAVMLMWIAPHLLTLIARVQFCHILMGCIIARCFQQYCAPFIVS